MGFLLLHPAFLGPREFAKVLTALVDTSERGSAHFKICAHISFVDPLVTQLRARKIQVFEVHPSMEGAFRLLLVGGVKPINLDYG